MTTRVVGAVLVVLTKHLAYTDDWPDDEFMIEALPIAGCLMNTGRVERSDVADVWLTWFDDDLSQLSDAAWQALLADLNAIEH